MTDTTFAQMAKWRMVIPWAELKGFQKLFRSNFNENRNHECIDKMLFKLRNNALLVSLTSVLLEGSQGLYGSEYKLISQLGK